MEIPERSNKQNIHAVFLIVLLFLAESLASTRCRARSDDPISDDAVTYQGVTIQPGDVINFLGGAITTGGLMTYGHTGLYLGINPETGKKSFLDFTTTKRFDGVIPSQGGVVELSHGTPHGFGGRILNQQQFLGYNGQYHEEFDVFRLRSVTVDQRSLVWEAMQISTKGYFLTGPLIGRDFEVCSTAVAAVLSKVTGQPIDIVTPDGFVGGQFQRYPQETGKHINILIAIGEAGREAREEDNRVNAESSAVFSSVAQEQTVVEAVDAYNKEHANIEDSIRKKKEYADYLEREMALKNRREVYKYIVDAVGLACANPEAFSYQMAHVNPIGVQVDSDLLIEFFAEDTGLNSCQQTVIKQLTVATSQVTSAQVLLWASEYREAHPSLVQKFITSVGDFLAASDNLTPSVATSSSGGGGSVSGDSPSSRDSSRQDNASQNAFQQSIEAQNKELSKYDSIVHKVYYGDGSPDWDGRR